MIGTILLAITAACWIGACCCQRITLDQVDADRIMWEIESRRI